MEIKIAVLADAANISLENKLNITGIFNRIQAGKFPATWPFMAFVLRLEAHRSEVGKHDIQIRIVDEDGGQIASIDGHFTIGRAKEAGLPITAQFIVPIANASFPKAGTYAFDILIDGRYEGTVQLFVVEQQQEKP